MKKPKKGTISMVISMIGYAATVYSIYQAVKKSRKK